MCLHRVSTFWVKDGQVRSSKSIVEKEDFEEQKTLLPNDRSKLILRYAGKALP